MNLDKALKAVHKIYVSGSVLNNPECLIDCIYTSRNFMKIYRVFVGNTFTARYKL